MSTHRAPGVVATTSMTLTIAAVWLGGVLPAVQDPPAVFRSSADLVSVDVAVRRGGRPVTGLGIHDFEVIDNGIPQQVAEMSYEKLPIDVTMALDVSESVTGALLDQLRRGVRQLEADLGPRDRLKLMTFNMRVARAMDFSSRGGYRRGVARSRHLGARPRLTRSRSRSRPPRRPTAGNWSCCSATGRTAAASRIRRAHRGRPSHDPDGGVRPASPNRPDPQDAIAEHGVHWHDARHDGDHHGNRR